MQLHLGVIDIPYGEAETVEEAYKSGHFSIQSTGFVAELLEEKYSVMDNFFYLHKDDIAFDMEKSLAGILEDMMMGTPHDADPFSSAMSKVEDQFKTYLDKEEIVATGQFGVPTKAALEGRSIRFKYKKGPRRPSFIDSGLYQANFKAWIE